jgi:hypothetical protein
MREPLAWHFEPKGEAMRRGLRRSTEKFEPKRGRRAAGVAFRAEGRSREARAEEIHDEARAE